MAEPANTGYVQDGDAAARTARSVKHTQRESRENRNVSTFDRGGSRGAGIDTVVWPVKVTGSLADGMHDGQIRFVDASSLPPTWVSALDGMSTMDVKILPFPGKSLAVDDEGLARLVGQTPSIIVDDVETGLKPLFVMMQPPPGWFARLTTSSSGKWKYYVVGWTGSAWADVGSEAAGFTAIPSTIDGTNLCNPVAGLRVWMIPSQTAGYQEFLPIGYADKVSSTYYPGLVSVETNQHWIGNKYLDTAMISPIIASVDPANAFVEQTFNAHEAWRRASVGMTNLPTSATLAHTDYILEVYGQARVQGQLIVYSMYATGGDYYSIVRDSFGNSSGTIYRPATTVTGYWMDDGGGGSTVEHYTDAAVVDVYTPTGDPVDNTAVPGFAHDVSGRYAVLGLYGVFGSFVSADNKTVTVNGGIITAIVPLPPPPPPPIPPPPVPPPPVPPSPPAPPPPAPPPPSPPPPPTSPMLFDSSGTFTPDFTGTIDVTARSGSGGGGGGSTNTGGAGGGGGGGSGYAKKVGIAVVSGTPYSVTVGAPGAGGASGSNGTAGGNSFFDAGTDCKAIGGGGGHTDSGATGGLAGTAGGGLNGDALFSGGAGGAGGNGDGLITGGAGGGGGGPAGTSGGGIIGGTAVTTTIGTGGAAGTGASGTGGDGGSPSTNSATDGSGDGGGGGGGGWLEPGKNGVSGSVLIEWV